MFSEIWKVIDGLPDYKISNWGRVLSMRTGNPKILKGYREFCDEHKVYRQQHNLQLAHGNSVKRTAHSLVMDAFGDIKPSEVAYINHINGNPYDNKIDNLEWVSVYPNCCENCRKFWKSKRREI